MSLAPDPILHYDAENPSATAAPARWRAGLARIGARLSRSPLVRGAAAWILLVAVAYLVGTLAIAPMIGEAAGISSTVYAMQPERQESLKRPEPTILITPIKRVASQATAASAPLPDAEKKHRRRHRRRRSLIPDEVFLGRSQSDRDGAGDPSARRGRDGEDSGRKDRHDDLDKRDGGDDSPDGRDDGER